jgi:hypothetical protein
MSLTCGKHRKNPRKLGLTFPQAYKNKEKNIRAKNSGEGNSEMVV